MILLVGENRSLGEKRYRDTAWSTENVYQAAFPQPQYHEQIEKKEKAIDPC